VAHAPDRAFQIVAGEFQIPWVVIVYVVGITSTVWHFANGLWLFAVDWGIVIGERAQRLAGYACIGFGVFLLAVGLNAMAGFIWEGGLLGGLVG
jgi:succinate dehydrogenase / fumarate reductase cytochrome b subunit